MEYHYFRIRAIDPRPDSEELNGFLRTHPVAGVTQEFVEDGHNSYWSVCVQVAGQESAEDKPRKRGSVDYREILSPEVFARFARLRALRNRLAEQQSTPPYAIFTNEQLAAMARLEKPTKEALAAIEGIGEKRLSEYADRFLAALREADA